MFQKIVCRLYSRLSMCIYGGQSFKDNDSVSQVGSHDEIVLYNKGRLLCMKDKPVE